MSESTVHRITFDLDRYQALVYDVPGGQPQPFDGVSRASTWLPQPVYVAGPRLERPDIWFLFGSGALVFGEEVARQLEPFVSYAGELLELRLSPNDEQLWALNVLQDVDALDPSCYSDDDVRIVPSFIEHRLPESGLFKVFPIEAANLFVVERNDDTETFIGRVERNGLRGIGFQTVWSTTTGPAIPDLS